MAYFPRSVMPKKLRRETPLEVDNAPTIYNARDYNIHHREILAIEKALIGKGSDPNAPIGVEQALSLLEGTLDGLFSNGTIYRASGIVKSGDAIPLPDSVLNTTAHGPLSTSQTSITVTSTKGFSPKGYITKINAIPMMAQTGGDTYGGLNTGRLTFQEVISYQSISGNTFVGCARALFKTNAQALPYSNSLSIGGNDGNVAVIVGGQASLFYSPVRIDVGDTAIVDSFVGYGEAAMSVGLKTRVGSTPTDVPNTSWFGYSLVVVGQFPDIDLSAVMSG